MHNVARPFKYRPSLYHELLSTYQGMASAANLIRYDEKSNLPAKVWEDLTLAVKPVDLEAYKVCKDYMENALDKISRGNGLFITGPPGNGKSTWAYKIAREYLEYLSLRNIVRDRPVYYANVPTLIEEIKQGFHDTALSRSIDIRLKEADLVIFDDIGAENSTDWAKEQLYQYINYRYSNNLACIFTSNLMLNQLEIRVADRINGSCQTLTFKGQSSRKQD